MQLISLESDYALRALIYLSFQPKGKISMVSEISESEMIPNAYLFKILRKLVKKGIVRSYRGPKGGYALARSPEKITFLEVIETLDGPMAVNRCLGEFTDCVLEPSCRMLNAWQRIQKVVAHELSSLTLGDLKSPVQNTLVSR